MKLTRTASRILLIGVAVVIIFLVIEWSAVKRAASDAWNGNPPAATSDSK